jgi:hypothetical protein
MRSHHLFFIIGALVFGLSTTAFAVPKKIVLSGHIAKPDGSDLTSSNVGFKLSVLDQAGACVVYAETSSSLDLSNANGNFEITLGAGTKTYPTDGRTLVDVFDNSAATIACESGGTITPTSTDTRSLTIQFIDNTESTPAWRTFTTGIPLTSVPSAFFADSASKLGTNVASDFVIKTGIPTCTAGQFLTWDGTSLSCNAAAAAGNYVTALTGDVTATGPGSSAATVAKLQGSTLTLTSPASGDFLRHNGTAFVNTGLVAADVPSLDWSKITTGKPTTLAGYGITDGGGSTSVTAPIINTGTASAPVIAISVATAGQNGYLSSSDFTTFNNKQPAGNYMTALTGDVTAAGPGSSSASVAKLQGTTLTLTSPSSGEFVRHNGTAFVNATLSAGDVPSLDWSKISSGKPTTLAGYGITDAVSSGNISVTAPMTNSGTASAPVITMPAATTVVNGYLSSSDFTTFNNKLSTTLVSGKIWVGSGANSASPVYPNGDVTMSNAGAFTVQKIQSVAVSTSSPFGSGQVLRYDGATQYTPSFIEISDMRSTVAPFNPVFTNAACNADESLHYISASDTFDCQLVSISDGQINYTNVNQKMFFAGPTNSTGTPTFRSIATADINGVAFVNGGNSFGTTTVFGTGDANNLIFATNGTGKMTLDTTGRLGIGYSSPRAALDVNGTILSSPAASNATATIDFLTGNLQYTSNSCGAFAFHNLKDGGSYMFVVKGSTSALCAFTAFSDAGTTGLTVHMPPDHATTIAGKHTIYNIAVLGADIYISWTPGY